MSAKKAENPLRNAKHEAVLQAYFADPERVGYRCYMGVYPNSTEAAAKTAFSRLLKNADFTARLEFLSASVAKEVSEKVAISVESVIAELAKIGFANMKDYFRDKGGFLVDRVTRDEAAAIAQIEVEEVIEGDGDDAKLIRKTKFKLHDKRAALVDIGKHLGAFVDKKSVELTGKDGGPIETKQDISELELARRIAFALEQGARSAPAPAAPAKPAKPAKAASKTPAKKGRKR